MMYSFLSITFLWILVGQSQATIESCQAIDLLFCSDCVENHLQCTACGSGYVVTNTGCIACPANCEECTLMEDSALNCTKCSTGYGVDYESNTCVACSANCEECTLTEDAGLTCTKCITGYGVDYKSNTCVDCNAVENCVKCEAFDTYYRCWRCIPGFILSVTLCHECPNNCAPGSCVHNETAITGFKTYCESCDSGYTTDSNMQCIACPANCEVCNLTEDAGLTCTKCSTGYGLDYESNMCVACSANCEECTLMEDAGLTCTNCSTGYGLDYKSNTCVACSANCEECTLMEDAGLTCTKCSTGYGLDYKSNTCVAYPENCGACTIVDSAAVCNSCNNGYYLDANNVCKSMTSLSEGCTDVSRIPKSCTVCQPGATLVSGKCLLNCYKCGNLTDGVPTSTVEDCNAPSNEYVVMEQCEYGCSITVKYEDGQMLYAARGCAVKATCLSDKVEQCTRDVANQKCLKCCDSGELCNGDFWDPSLAPANHVISVVMLLVAMLTAYVIN